jgi:methyl-accepting chemotaxis protein
MKKLSMNRKLIILSNLISIMTMVLLAVVVILDNKESNEKSLAQQMSMISGIIADSSNQNIWNLETDILQKTADKTIESSNVDAVLFFDDKQQLINKSDAIIEELENSFMFENEIKFNDKIIGSVKLYYNTSEIKANLIESVKLIITIVIAAQLLLSFGLFFVVRRISNSIQSIVNRLMNTSKVTSDGSLDLKKKMQEFSSSMGEQGAAIRETVSTLEQIKAMGISNADHAKKSTEKAQDCHTLTMSGKDVVANLMEIINVVIQNNESIHDQMELNNKNMQEILSTINEISSKTNVINDIVFQTKLLSFNASVEAARAGENGKGFAVVAEEIGNLATMSGQSSNEISALLDSSISKVQQIADESKKEIGTIVASAKTKLQDAEQVTKKCVMTFDDIVVNVEEVRKMMDSVYTSVGEQSEGVGNISDAMKDLDKITIANSKGCDESLTASNLIADQAVEITDIVVDLEIEVLGDNNQKPITKKMTKKKVSKELHLVKNQYKKVG